MLGYLNKHARLTRTQAGRRKLRLFGCACIRRVWRLLTDKRSQEAVELGERYADGLATASQLKQGERQALAAIAAADAAATAAGENTTRTLVGQRRAAAAAVQYVVRPQAWSAAVGPAVQVDVAMFFKGRGERKAQCVLVREIFGDPFRPTPVVEPAWLAWQDGAVRALAQSIYNDHAFGRLRSLAGLLKKAGCKDAALLRHLRGAGPHVLGCWALDLLLGRGALTS
jgi:hypothetical protein